MALFKGGCWLLVFVMVVVTIQNVSGKLHAVGGTKWQGWKPGKNYTEWAAKETFLTGDWLYWGYDKYYYSVYMVNQASYESCNTNDALKNITGGAGRDVHELKDPSTYYFISGGGYCWHGMKVAVTVLYSENSTVV